MTVVASKYARIENDLYQTEPWATEVLLRSFPMSGMIVWEPAAGNHLVADVLRSGGAEVITTDIAVYDREHDGIFDFLNGDDWGAPSVCDFPHAIITNPPYGKQNRDAARFAALALRRCSDFVALLLTAKFDSGNTRHHLFRDNPRFAAKIVLVDRISFMLNDEGGTEDHAWFIWTAAPRLPRAPVLIYGGKDSA